jgi:hypothetical protein
MAKGINLSVAADTKAFVDGINKGVIEPLEGAVDALDDLAKAGDNAGEDITQAMKDAQKATETNQDEFDKLSRVIKETGRSGRTAGDDIKAGMHGANQGLQDFKEESRQTAREAAQSFDGSAQSIVQVFQEIAANAFIGWGPAAAGAGIAAAAGIGLLTTAFQQQQEQADKAKAKIGEMGKALIEGTAGYENLIVIVENLKEMATVSDGSVKSLEDIRKQSEKLGVTFEQLAQTYAGSADNLDQVVGKIQELQDEQRTLRDQADDNDRQSRLLHGIKIQQLEDQINTLDKVRENTKKAAEEEKAYVDSGAARMAEKQKAIENINTAYDDTVGSVTDYLDAETGVLDVQAYLDAIAKRRDALNDYQKNLATSGLTDQQKSALNDMGVESASIWLEAYNSKTTSSSQKKQMADSLSAAASDASGVAKNVIDKAFAKPTEHTVKVEADISKAKETLENWVTGQRLRVPVDLIARNGAVIYP